MKAIFPSWALLLNVCAAFSQGTVHFDNNVPGVVVAPVYHSGMWRLEGQGYSAQLWGAAGANVTETFALRPSPDVTTFQTGTNAGFVVPIIATFTNIPPDAPAATMQMMVWDNQGGTITNFPWTGLIPAGRSPIFHVFKIGGTTNPPADLVGCESFTLMRSYRLSVKLPLVAWGCDDVEKTPADLTNAIAIAAGGYHQVALKADGTVVAWDNSGVAQTNVPAGLSNVIAIAAGGWHDLALRADGTVVAWGRDTSGQCKVPVDLTNVVRIGCGDSTSFALRADGTVAAWGSTAALPEGLTNVVAITGGQGNNTALRDDGSVIIWASENTEPMPSDWTNITAIAAGRRRSVVLRSDTTVARWGDDETYAVPEGLSNVVAIAAGVDGTLALKADGTVVGWGYNFCGESGVPIWLSNVVAIAESGAMSLALVGDGPPTLQGPLLNPTQNPNGFSVSLQTRSGYVYRLEYKVSLADSRWVSLPLVAGTGGIVSLTDPGSAAEQRFYRVRVW